MKTTIFEKLKLPQAVKLFGLRQMLRFWNLPEWGKLTVGFLILLLASAFLWPLAQWLWGLSLGKTLIEYYVFAFSKIPYIDSLPNFTISMLVAIPLIILISWIMWKIIEFQKLFDSWHSPSAEEHVKVISNYVEQIAASSNGYERVQAVVKPYAERYRKLQQAKVERTNAWDISPTAFSTSARTIILLFVMWAGFTGLTEPIFQQEIFQPRVCALLNIDKDTCTSATGKALAQTAVGAESSEAKSGWAIKLLELRAQAVVLVLTALAALVLWVYRDLNKRREQETAHREKLFGEHKQLIEWAAQSPASTEPEPNSQTGEPEKPVLQAAAIYQLAPFIRDRNASFYQRGTLETLRALSNADIIEKSVWFLKWQKAFDAFSAIYKSQSGSEWNHNELESARSVLFAARPAPKISTALRAVGAVLREYPTLLYHREFKPDIFSLWAWEAKGLNFTGCDLRHAKFHGADMSMAQFHGADVRKAQFHGADVRVAQCRGADVRGAQFHGADLGGGQFHGADVGEAQFHGANVSVAQFHGADVRGALFHGADVRVAQFHGANVSWAEFHGADVRWGEFHSADVSAAKFHGADMSGVKFCVMPPEGGKLPTDDNFTKWADAVVPEPKLQINPEWAAWLSERIQRGAISVATLDEAALNRPLTSPELRAAAKAAQTELAKLKLQPTVKNSPPEHKLIYSAMPESSAPR